MLELLCLNFILREITKYWLIGVMCLSPLSCSFIKGYLDGNFQAIDNWSLSGCFIEKEMEMSVGLQHSLDLLMHNLHRNILVVMGCAVCYDFEQHYS